MRIGLFLKYDREVVNGSENREIPDLWGRVDRYETTLSRKVKVGDTTSKRIATSDCFKLLLQAKSTQLLKLKGKQTKYFTSA